MEDSSQQSRPEKIRENRHRSNDRHSQAQQTLSGIRRDYDRMKQDLLQGREPRISVSKGRQFALIRFVRDVPPIIGVDLKTHGPFHKEDVARLPQENAEGLIRQGAAVEVRASNQDNE